MTDIRMMRGPLANIRPANQPFVPREIVIDDKALGLVWSEARTVANGQWRIQTCPVPTGHPFWVLWRSHKDAIKKMGISVSKKPTTNQFEAVKWLKPSEEEIAHREATVAASWAATSSTVYPAPNGLARYPYQNAGISFGLSREGVLIGDDMGLGKSGQAIGIIDYSGAENALIICPASLKINWQRELNMWLTRPLRVAVINSGKKWPADADIYVINYDLLHTFDEHIKARCWDIVVLDEAHMIKEPKSRRTRHIAGNRNLGIKKLMAKRRVAMTGTPISNRPAELWPIINYIAPEQWNSWPSFAKRYCGGKVGNFGFDAKGATNLDELHDRLRETVMIRRRKMDVLKELPPKTRQLLTLPSTGAEHEIAAEMDAYTNLKERIAELRAKFELAKASPVDGDYKAATEQLKAGVVAAFNEMARARKAVAIAKLPTLIDQVEDAVASSGKVVVFCHHREVHHALMHHFGDAAVGIIGGLSQTVKQEAVDRFQKDPNVKVFVGSISAAGVGITLTAASHVIMGELDWVPGNMAQAEDRCHRIGQSDNVLAQWIVLEGSLDSHIAKTLMAKTQLITQALDVKSGDEQAVDPAQAEFAQKISVFEDEEAATKATKRQRILEDAEHLTPADCADIHDALRAIAMLDGDRARAKNMLGFAKIDTRIGHDLAGRTELTPREAALGVRIANKYRRQLPDDLAASIATIWTTLRGDQS